MESGHPLRCPSPEQNTPPSSPAARHEPVSEFETSSSSPLQNDVSSPLRRISPDSSPSKADSPPSSPYRLLRKRYTYCEGEIPHKQIYWPRHLSIEDDVSSALSDHEEEVSHNQLFVSACDINELSCTSVVNENQELEPPCDQNVSFDSEESEPWSDSSKSSDAVSTTSSPLRGNGNDTPSDSDNDQESDSASTPAEISSSDSEDEVMEMPIGSYKINENSELTVNEGVVILMELFLKHKLDKTTLKGILEAVLKFIPEKHNFPKTKHMLFKYVHDLCPPVLEKCHYYCTTCLYYIGEQSTECNLCHSKESHRFFQLPLYPQLKCLFETHNLADIIDKYTQDRESRPESARVLYCDITDGSEYKRAHLPGRYDLTLLAHTDGVSVSKSSEVSLYPLEYVICEVPPQTRFKLVIVAGIWLDSLKPNMNCFLKPFIDEIIEINKTGISWTHPRTKEKHTSYVVAPVFCADAPVRGKIQNILIHGGRYCCHSCEQKMVKLPSEPLLPGVKQKRRRRVFSLQETPNILRTAQRMEAQSKVTEQCFRETGKLNPKKGVKGMSVVCKSPNCDWSTVVYPEYMHILLGIMKQFMVLWFETDGEWNLKKHRNDIDSFLENLRVPDFVTRIPRSTECYAKWKANEFRSFLLYFSLVVLSIYMTEEYSQHWMLLVNAFYLLLQDSVSENDVQKSEIMIRMFLRDFTRLYRASDFTYNLHNLEHFGLLTRRWGPLWSNSAFLFENFNGSLRKNIHGTKNQGKELVNTIQLSQAVQVVKAHCVGQSQREIKQTQFSAPARDVTFSKTQSDILKESALKCESVYLRADVKGEVYTSRAYSKQKKRNNYTISFKDSDEIKQYGEIICFVVCRGSDYILHEMMFVNRFSIEHVRMLTHSESAVVVKHLIPIKETSDMLLLPIENILTKVIRVAGFVAIRPNTFEENL